MVGGVPSAEAGEQTGSLFSHTRGKRQRNLPSTIDTGGGKNGKNTVALDSSFQKYLL